MASDGLTLKERIVMDATNDVVRHLTKDMDKEPYIQELIKQLKPENPTLTEKSLRTLAEMTFHKWNCNLVTKKCKGMIDARVKELT